MSLRAERPTEWTQEQPSNLIDDRARSELQPGSPRIVRSQVLEQLITPRCYSRLDNPADVMASDRPRLGTKLCR